MRTVLETYGTTLNAPHLNYKDPTKEEKKKGSEKIFEEIIVENFPNVGNEIVNQVQEEQRVPGRINPRRNMPRHIVIKLTQIKDNEIMRNCVESKY